MPLSELVLQFLLAAAIVVAAGVLLTKAADKIAKVTGLGGLLIGSVFLAAATSLPELMVDISAVRLGKPDLAVGDLFGSSLFNLLILAIVDLMHKSRGRLFSRASAEHAMMAAHSIALTALAAMGVLLAPKIEAYAIGGMSFGTLAVLVVYVWGLQLVIKDQRKNQAPGLPQVATPSRRSALVKPVFSYIFGAIVILMAAPYLASAAAGIADTTGLGSTFVGTTIVALCTSLPELVACLAAVRMGSYDLALGNVFGSNAFNMVLLVPLDFVAEGPLLAGISPTHVVTSLAAMVITAIAIMGQLYHVEKRRQFVEPDAFLVIVLVLAALLGVYALR